MSRNATSIIHALGWALLLGASLPALADQVKVPVGQQAGSEEAGDVPRSGMNKEQVEERYGSPQARRAAVGDPPISSWEYEHYVVYFEGDTVLRSVVKHRPRAGAATDGARPTTNDG